jgi:hypothetical protein
MFEVKDVDVPYILIQQAPGASAITMFIYRNICFFNHKKVFIFRWLLAPIFS